MAKNVHINYGIQKIISNSIGKAIDQVCSIYHGLCPNVSQSDQTIERIVRQDLSVGKLNIVKRTQQSINVIIYR